MISILHDCYQTLLHIPLIAYYQFEAKICNQKHLSLTGDGLPVAAHRNVAPVEFENRIKGEGVVTNFGPIKSISLTLEDD